MAAIKAVDPRVTYAELEQWHDHGRRYELYGGEVIVVPAPVPIHQIVVHRISEILGAYAEQTGGLMLFSPIDIVFSEYDVLQPDVVFFNTLRRPQIDLRSAIRVVPDLVGEVLSRNTAARDRGRKLELFERYGVPEYWILDPAARTLELLTNAGGRFQTTEAYDEAAIITSPTLPALRFATADLFRV
jgi:Uma2 family endonuclease